ncbi:hypothetical protein AT574_03790 [Phaeobacter inhibens]|nr:hypothetical protein AT574_03790 [Phaeobacter inhibens]
MEDLTPETHRQIWAEHEPAVRAFLVIQTQWRGFALPDGSTRWVGLDYAAASNGLALAGLKIDPKTWAKVQVIECAARAALNERS